MPGPVRRAKKRPPYVPPERSDRIYLVLPPRDVAFFKFMLEGWDNLALLTVTDRFASAVRLLFSPDDRARVQAFLAVAFQEIPGLRVRFDPKNPGTPCPPLGGELEGT